MRQADNTVNPLAAERMARREQAKAMRALFAQVQTWLSRRFVGGTARTGVAH